MKYQPLRSMICIKILLRYSIIYGFLHLFTINLFAQTDLVKIKHFSMPEGMSQVSANDLLRDDDGFVWIATADGLNRFDGNLFKHYQYNPSDSTSISGNFITKLAKAGKNKIWVGTIGQGVNYYDSQTDVFTRIALTEKTNAENITGIVTIDSNEVWVSTLNYGLFHLKLQNSDVILKENYLVDFQISSLYRDDAGIFWIGGPNGDIVNFKVTPTEISKTLKVEGNVQSFLKVKNNILIGSYGGFYIYETDNEKLIKQELEISGQFTTLHVVDFLVENQDLVWVATGRGVYLIDVDSYESIQKIEYSDNSQFGLSNNTVLSLLKVSDNLLFAGTANGLNLIDFKNSYFRNISKNKSGAHLLNDNVIFSIYRNEHLWVGTSDGGLNLITDNEVYYFIDNKNNPNSLIGSVVRAIVHDTLNDRLWLGTSRGLSMIELDKFNPEKPIFKNFVHDPNDYNSICGNFIKGLTLDRNNNLWGATFECGIFMLKLNNETTYEITNYSHLEDNPNSLVSNVGQSIAVDKENNIWIGTQNGLSKLEFEGEDYTNPVFTNYSKIENSSISISHNSVYDILFDDDQNMWLGTRDGLNLFSDGKFDSWTEQPQFPNAVVYIVQDDQLGNLWLGTNDGIVKFNKQSETFSHFDVQDDIQGKEFDIHARYRDQDGTIYLGGVDGITYFNSGDLISIDKPQDLYFSALRVKEKIIKPSDHSQDYLAKTIEKTERIKFNYNEFPFYLEFSSIDYRLHKNVQYAYKLLPLDDDWNILSDNKIQFLNLSSGNYNLQLTGFSRGRQWDVRPLEMAITVTPPWWYTKLALLAYLIVGALIIYWLYKIIVSRKLAYAESSRLREIDQLKNSFFTNITHEFRTPITVIMGMVDNLKDNISKNNKDVEKPLEIIQRNAGNLLQLVNNMLDLTKLETARLELSLEQSDIIIFSKYIFESFRSLAQDMGIEYTFYAEQDSLIMDFDKDKFSAIMTNLLMNAIKFTPKNGKIILHLRKETSKSQDYLQIKIIDTGIGLSSSDLPHIFDKFYQVDNSSIRDFEGTGIGLAITKELVELMNGIINVKSELKKGSEFIVLLPIENNSVIATDIIKPNLSLKSRHNEKIRPIELVELLDIESDLPIALIIEDNVDVVYYLSKCLEINYNIIKANNGEKGVNMAIKNIPDIIICDVMMPIKDGFEVCSSLKNNPLTNHIPIIMLTAKSNEQDRLEGLSRGADAYLIKPFNKNELYARIEHLVKLRKMMIAKFSSTEYIDYLNIKNSSPESEFLKKVISIIHKYIDDQDFKSPQLATEIGLSESQLYRKLKAISDKSTAIFIRSVRLQKAKEMIQSSDCTISEIAYSVGFSDPSWFSKVFKEEFGKTPSEVS